MSSSAQSHLFISYAVEDAALADWLARKLAGQGYAVWLDRLKLLGGEPWPRDIDKAIKERTFRMLALLSDSSLQKPNPSKERTLAMSISKARGIPDFLIPLKLDSAELDWMTADLTYLPFNRGWAEGWRQLIKKLEALDAPKLLADGRGLAAATFDAGEGLVVDKAERIVTNAILIKQIPQQLTMFSKKRISELKGPDESVVPWAYYKIGDQSVVAFGDPPLPDESEWEKTRTFKWADVEECDGIATSNIVRHLIERTLACRLRKAGCYAHPKKGRTYYLRPPFTEDGKLHFVGRTNKNTWCKIEGRTKVLRPGKPAEHIRHLFAFELFRWHLSQGRVAIQIRPSLVFTNAVGDLILDNSVGTLRRKLTKSWWNHKWLNRLLAAAEIVEKASPLPGDNLELADGLLCLNSTKALDESALSGDGTEDEVGEIPDIHIDEADEREDDSESA